MVQVYEYMSDVLTWLSDDCDPPISRRCPGWWHGYVGRMMATAATGGVPDEQVHEAECHGDEPLS